ncbi:MAG TPA: beta-propeller fold lactonase family protein [Kofleriaceae bacterium]|nr:beta-propeller fold lactonase family protein [Kofleriaceae bacterium]
MGCGTDAAPPGGGDDVQPPPPPPPTGGDPGVFSARISRSSTIAITEDNSHLAMVNPDDGSLSVFATADNSRTAKVPTGANPSSVVISADNKTAYVSNRGDATVVKITGIDGGTPVISGMADVGAEPAGLALSPSGKRLFVAEFAGSRVSIINTSTMAIESSVAVDRPRALLVTNNGDTNDADENLVVTQYYGVPVEGREAKDDGRTGRVLVFSLATLTKASEITLSPIDSGLGVMTSPNQLAAIAAAGNRVYVTSVSASPEGPTKFDGNVFPVVYVADLGSASEVRDGSGTANLTAKLRDAIPNPTAASPRFFPGDLSDIAFLGNTQVAYAVGKAGDVMVRMAYGTNKLDVGSTQNKEIDLAGNATIGTCQEPIGVVVSQDLMRAYVNCWVSRRLAMVDLSIQTMTQTFEASPAPANAVEASIQRGKRFYFTGRARWSAAEGNGAKGGEGWSSCASCHPDGLSDNITWIFGSGPRQTTSMDGSFSHGAGPQKQRMFNWTGVNDEMHDFEANTRGVSGGLGAITTAAVATDCNQLDKEAATPVVLNGALAASNKDLADNVTLAACGHKDWDDINNFVKTIAPAHSSKLGDSQAVARGRQLFLDGGCAKCHGGSGWTVSSRPYNPAGGGAPTFGAVAFARPIFLQAVMYDVPRNKNSNQPILGADDTGPAEAAEIAVPQLACVLRNVGTFGIPDDNTATDALERRANGALRAEGRAGYNVPSLYGLALGAPYLHHGQAASLEVLFSDARWNFHTSAGNANFSFTLQQPGKLNDLVSFLLGIDANTPEIALPNDPATGASFDACIE